MKILYFSWLREFVGLSSEERLTDCRTVMELVRELSQTDERYRKAFSDMSVVRVAVDQDLVEDLNVSIVGAKEVAFFPPMTGG